MSKEIIKSALDWLEANPDNHITSDFARTTNDPNYGYNDVVAPTDPRATCFCALGRIAKEAGITEVDPQEPNGLALSPFEETQKFLNRLGLEVSTAEVYEINDAIGQNVRNLTKPQRIAKLRQLLGVS